MKKDLWLPLFAAFGTMAILYTIGFFRDIDWLILKISPSYSEISLVPIIVGCIVGFIFERIIKFTT